MEKKRLYFINLIFLIIILFSNPIFILAGNTNDVNYYPKRIKWYPARGTGMNTSHYVYHDMNRNGIYDIGDRPLVDFAIKMTRPDGSEVIRRSNLNGFTNFTNSALDKPVDIYEAGEYMFELIVPEGWKVTSNNAIQKIKWREGITERSSLLAESVPIPVGVVQEPYIEGKIDDVGDDVSITCLSPSNEKISLNVDENGKFKIYGEYGYWTFIIKKGNEQVLRSVKLGTIPVKMSTIYLNEEIEKKETTKLVDFENITYSNIQKIPNGISGVNWNNLLATDFLFYKGEGYVNNRMSGKYIGYNTSGQPVTISKLEGFDFYGGYFGVAWRNSAEGETLKIKAYRDDEIVDECEFELSALGPFYFDADYRNITRIELKTKHYWQFVTDDILIGID